MEKQDLKQFTEIMMGLAENYPGAVLTGNGLKLRFAALKESSIDQVIRAATKLIRTHKYNSMPTTADMINAMEGHVDMDHRAEMEAGKVLDVLKLYGTSVTPVFNDPITKHLMSHRWRWYSWASKVKEDDLKWWSWDFVRAYKARAAGVMVECSSAQLPLIKVVNQESLSPQQEMLEDLMANYSYFQL